MGNHTSTACKVDRKGCHGTGENTLKKRGRRCRRRNKKRSNARISRRGRTTNPFILFYLRMQRKRPNKPIIEVARKAGKLWCQMSINQRKKYIVLAQAVKKREEARRHKRRCLKHK